MPPRAYHPAVIVVRIEFVFKYELGVGGFLAFIAVCFVINVLTTITILGRSVRIIHDVHYTACISHDAFGIDDVM